MSELAAPTIAPATGKLGVVCVGLGAVTTTFIAGVELAKRGMGDPVGSLTQMGTIRLGKRTEDRSPFIRDFVPIAGLDDIVFGAWDPFEDDAYVSAQKAGVLDAGRHLEPIAESLRDIQPMPAAFDHDYVKRLDGQNVKADRSKRGMLEGIRQDLRDFREQHGCDRLIMLWAASTEVYLEIGPAHADIESFEAAIDAGDPSIAPSMLYAYAALLEGVPFANGAPNLTVDVPALREFAADTRRADLRQGLQDRPDAAEDGPGADVQGADARDRGLVLDQHPRQPRRRGPRRPGDFKTKEESKLGVLDYILQPETYPELYGDLYHKVRINYYPPRGDNKEGWDNIDLFGWLGYPMQIKVDFLCRDSILAAPLCLDLVLFLDLAQRAGMSGIQEWLSFYFKAPQVAPGLYPEHDLFIQQTKLKNTLRWMMGEDQITHLGVEYYADDYLPDA